MSEIREQLIGKVWPVLDDGSIQLIDVMGDDQAIVDAARVSFGKGTKRLREDRDLLRFLMRHHHETPFEMAEIKIRVRVPMDCWRQWIRHRTANVNEYSTRYSEAIDSMQKTSPDRWRLQSGANKQGSAGFLSSWLGVDSEDDGDSLTFDEQEFHRKAREVYENRLRLGVAREQARKDLPLSTYTEAYWKCDLRNVLHFLGLRMDAHAQAEIRAYANIIGAEIVAPLFSLTWEAFTHYRLNALVLSALDIQAVRKASVGDNEAVIFSHIDNRREKDECRAKLVRLGLLSEVTS